MAAPVSRDVYSVDGTLRDSRLTELTSSFWNMKVVRTATLLNGRWDCKGWSPVLQTGNQTGSIPVSSTN